MREEPLEVLFVFIVPNPPNNGICFLHFQDSLSVKIYITIIETKIIKLLSFESGFKHLNKIVINLEIKLEKQRVSLLGTAVF